MPVLASAATAKPFPAAGTSHTIKASCQKDMQGMTKTRVAVLGAGFMGGTHARAYKKIPDVEIAAI